MKYQKLKTGIKVIESDHNPLIGTFSIPVCQVKSREENNEVFNFKDPEGQKVYKELTSGDTLSSISKNSNIVEMAHRIFYIDHLERLELKVPSPPAKM